MTITYSYNYILSSYTRITLARKLLTPSPNENERFIHQLEIQLF